MVAALTAVVEAYTNCDVLDAKTPFWNHSGVVVACTETPKLVRPVVNGHDPPPPATGHVVRQVSPVRQIVVAAKTVDEPLVNVRRFPLFFHQRLPLFSVKRVPLK